MSRSIFKNNIDNCYFSLHFNGVALTIYCFQNAISFLKIVESLMKSNLSASYNRCKVHLCKLGGILAINIYSKNLDYMSGDFYDSHNFTFQINS